MLEETIELRVCGWARTRGIWNIKLGRDGYPDRLFFPKPGRVAWVEFKAPTGELRPSQVNQIEALRRRGEAVAVCSTFKDACAFLDAQQSMP
jgi:hypothetical protein